MEALALQTTFSTKNNIELQHPRRRLPGTNVFSRSRNEKQYCGGNLRAVLDALASSDDVFQALKPWSGRLDKKEQSVVLKEQRDWLKASRVFDWLKAQSNYHPNVFLYNIILRTLGRAKKWEAVEGFFREMQSQNVLPTNVTYSTLIDMYGRAGMKDEALCVYRQLKERGLHPDEVMVSTLINMHRRFGNLSAAEEAFGALRNGGNIPKNPDTYNTMMAMYGEQGRLSDAAEVFGEMMKAGLVPTIVTFNIMIHTYGKIGRVKEAELMMAKMKERGCSPDVTTYNSLIDMYVKNSMMEMAGRCFSEMRSCLVVPDEVTHRTLMMGYASHDMVKEAEGIGQQMEASGVGVDETTYVGMGLMYMRTGDMERGRKLVEYLNSGEGLSVNSYIAVMDVYGELGMLGEAKQMLNHIRERKGLKEEEMVCAYNVMIKAYSLQREYSCALELLFSMEEKEGVSPNQVTFHTVTQMIAKAEMINREKERQMQRVMEMMRAVGCAADVVTYSMVISMNAGMGNVQEAEATFTEMRNAGLEADGITYSALLNAYAEAGIEKEANDTLERMKLAGYAPDDVTYVSMMKLYSNLGMVSDVEKIYSEVFCSSSSSSPSLFASNTLLHAYIIAGMFREAEGMFRRMEKGVVGVNAVSCTMMVNAYRLNKLVEEGLEIAKLMTKRKEELMNDVGACNAVVAMFTKAGRVREAVESLHWMRQMGLAPTRHTRHCVEVLLRRCGCDLPREFVRSSLSVGLAVLWLEAGIGEEEAMRLGREVERGLKLKKDVWLYDGVMYVYGRCGRVEEALRVYVEMESMGVEMNEGSYLSVIVAYGNVGLVEGVRRMFMKMKERGIQPSVATYRAVMEAYTRAGRSDLVGLVSQELNLSQFVRQHGVEMMKDDDDSDAAADDDDDDDDDDDEG